MIRSIVTISTAITLLSAAACAVSGALDKEVEVASELSTANHVTAPTGRLPGPPPCDTDADCSDKCPKDALGCACVETPRGDSVCAPMCEDDADCPAPIDDRPPLFCHEGICVPPPPPPCRSGDGGPQPPPSAPDSSG
jgi:hypothetical protein